ncbi:RNA polymerase sigma factor [Aquimarina rubra]|uniref:RNA polymerase sigma factor n=1 Tax=Aquimarina rubra TaxID=1920033 RepID=A0ABW5LFC3_9FLAO
MDSKKEHFHQFLNDHIGIIKKLCRGYTNNSQDFEDYVQDVCYQLWKSLDNFRGESKSSTWVYRVTLNVCMYNLKKKKRVQIIPTDRIEINRKLDEQVDEDQSNDNYQLLFEAIRQLQTIDRAIIMLYLEKKEYKEISDVVGLQANNIGVRVNRIKKKLKDIIDERLRRTVG